MKQLKNSSVWLTGLICILSCNHPTAEKKSKASEDTTARIAAIHDTGTKTVHWSYTEEGGPEEWARLSPVYADCGSGKSQSPVNLLSGADNGSPEWKIEYKTTTLQISHNAHVEELINNGHTIQVTPQEGSTITYGGKLYHLKQFHFHTPSEHTIDGQHYPMEIHLVHQADDNSLAVIGVLVQAGKHNKAFDKLIQYLPNAVGEKKTYDSVTIEIGINVPKDLYAYHYIGSLTTPPCTENVQWLVMKNPVSMSKEQIAEFSSRMKSNNRPVQPMNGRKPTIDDISTNH
jgi:carbonic anhydrase